LPARPKGCFPDERYDLETDPRETENRIEHPAYAGRTADRLQVTADPSIPHGPEPSAERPARDLPLHRCHAMSLRKIFCTPGVRRVRA